MHHIKQFQSLVALTKVRHFARAADSIGLTQSALSQNIKKLEDYYGVALFERRNRQVALTAYGEVIFKAAVQTLDAMTHAEREIRLLQNLDTGQLNVGVDPYCATSLLAPALSDLLVEHKNLRFIAHNGDWETMEVSLMSDSIDLYFGIEPENVNPDIQLLKFTLPTPLILCRADHPLAMRSIVTLADAMFYPIVAPAPPAWYIGWAGQQVDALNNRIDVRKLNFLEADSIAMVKSVASVSHGITAALPTDVARELEAGEFVLINLENWPTRMIGCMAFRASRTLPPAAKLLMEHYQQRVEAEISNYDNAFSLYGQQDS